MKVSFIGLGVMGYPMAGHLVKAGHQVTVYNRTLAKAEKWRTEFNGYLANTPKEAVQDSEIVFVCVGNDDDLRQVMYGETGILAGVKSNTLIVDHTTTSADVAREIYAKAKQQNVSFIDAPVSGGQAGAENGVLTVMVGGDLADYEKAEPFVDRIAINNNLLSVTTPNIN